VNCRPSDYCLDNQCSSIPRSLWIFFCGLYKRSRVYHWYSDLLRSQLRT